MLLDAQACSWWSGVKFLVQIASAVVLSLVWRLVGNNFIESLKWDLFVESTW